ncbi:early nodulin-like protein 13 [Silene latifolia]|uniref:early nodulin-like protein 13 n=1 Tax=Silene latifolia TaxID=37657 RepID=UPI003D78B12B
MAFSSKMRLITLVLGIACLVSLIEGRDHLIGGKPDAWKVPSSSDSESLNKWASKNRFVIGDNLVWKYDSKKDSVLQVTREAYLTCNTTNPIAEHKNDETKVVLDKAGPHYFISGLKDNCDKGEKIIVVVITPRSKPSGTGISPALAPSSPAPESGAETPAVPPTSNAAGVKGGLMGVVGVLAWFVFM